ncbi:MAG: NHL repeat-containing protein [Gammaproteobacteria bacterium]|nr:NHL repeat-containing protein [Gammaproteobacteria bacterium]
MISRSVFALLLALAVSLNLVNAAEVVLSFVGASKAQLDNPHDLKLTPDGRYLFVSDVGNNRIAILDPESLELLAEFGSDHQSGTHDVDFDSRGRAYVADTHNNRVTIYEMDGTSATLVGELSERIRGPEGVLVHPNGLVYVAGAWSGNVVAFRDGRVVDEMTGLASPHDLELAKDGNIWLADAGNSRMLLLSPDLEIEAELGRKEYDFNGVRYLDLTANGTIIAADKNNHAVKFISADGKLLHVLGNGSPARGVNRFRTPEGVEVRGSELWLSDSGNDRVVKYSLDLN